MLVQAVDLEKVETKQLIGELHKRLTWDSMENRNERLRFGNSDVMCDLLEFLEVPDRLIDPLVDYLSSPVSGPEDLDVWKRMMGVPVAP